MDAHTEQTGAPPALIYYVKHNNRTALMRGMRHLYFPFMIKVTILFFCRLPLFWLSLKLTPATV